MFGTNTSTLSKIVSNEKRILSSTVRICNNKQLKYVFKDAEVY